eukprot:TRINITY_DN26997_c0_g1_i1.p1 TRINITY_DN26997_c0_g1~~TRINITY_DN26997_c0_g1_i1.p1  ORF type:complete len:772 (-),score=139.95 TRINITY_DN26997_c0_g1_i1:156-2471(-)
MSVLEEDQLDKLEEFIFSNNLDDDAQEALWGCTPDIWAAVMKRGNVKSLRDPTRIIKQRIQEAQSRQRPPAAVGKPHSGEPQQSGSDGTVTGQSFADIEDFIAQHDFDEKAISVLRECDEQTQQVVLERGSLHEARNMSAMLLSRIRDARKAGLGNASAGKGQESWKPERSSAYHQKPGQQDAWKGAGKGEQEFSQEGCDEGEVEAFLAECDLDEKAAEALRSAAPNVQRVVIDRGSLSSARNPSGALMGRIRDAQAGKTHEYNAAYQRPAQHPAQQASWRGAGRGAQDSSQNEVDGQELENFIVDCELDERAAEALRTASPHAQRAVMDRGPLTSARNPSGALMARLRDAQSGKGQQRESWQPEYSSGYQAPAQQDGGVDEGELENFLAECNVDERAAEAVRTAEPHVQRAVIDRGPLTGARNPSGALMARLRDAQSGKGGKGPMQAPAGPRSAYGESRVDAYGGGRDTFGNGTMNAYGKGAIDAYSRGSGVGIRAAYGQGSVSAYGGASRDANGGAGREARAGGRMDACGAGARATYGLASRPAYGGGSRDAYGVGQATSSGRGSASVGIPKVTWLSFGPDMSLVGEGMPDTAPMILYDKQQSIFQSASYMISDLVTDMSDVQIHHDEDWKQWPMVGEEYKEQTGEENCFAIATSTEHNKWAAGFHAGKKGRETAAKLALAVAIAAGTELEEKLYRNYPEFRTLLDEGGSTPAASTPASQGGVKRKADTAFDAFSPDPAQSAGAAPGAASRWIQRAPAPAQSADQGYLL